MMKEIVFLSGKGGTGKTSLCSSCVFLQPDCVMVDYDVEASNLDILFDLQLNSEEEIISGQIANINPERCIECMLCEDLCRFEAIDNLVVQEIECEGCGLCFHLCSVSAISMFPNNVGKLYHGVDSEGTHCFYTKVKPGAGNSGKIVTQIKTKARELAEEKNTDFILADGPPGIGCSVIASLTGASLIVMVTEPGISAFDDMKRLWQLLQSRSVPAVIVINKWDLNPDYCQLIEEWAAENQIPVVGRIPYSGMISKNITNAVIPASDSNLVSIYKDVWQEILKSVMQ
ncbi:MAG: 4Fe-4S binding protein [Syntrophomonadaceae bacterium]|nr:4Fe-4S binding protein [Syntrophomonadaceae bacterium]